MNVCLRCRVCVLLWFTFAHFKLFAEAERNVLEYARARSNFIRTKRRADPSLAIEACEGGVLVNKSIGTIHSPGYYIERRYPNDANCTWIIKAPVGKVVRIDIKYLSLEKDCRRDFVKIYNYDDDRRLSRLITFCGTVGRYAQRRRIYTSYSGVLVHFMSQSNTTRRGFLIGYAVKHVYKGCYKEETADLTTYSGKLRNPYPGVKIFPHRYKCSWLISAPLKKRIKLSFLSFHLSHNKRCALDQLIVRDVDKDGPILGDSGRGNVGPVILSSRNTLYLQYSSQGGFSCIKYLAKWKFVSHKGCYGGEVLTRKSGQIRSPPFLKKADCMWLVKVPPNKVVRLRIIQLDIESGKGCTKNAIEIYNHNGIKIGKRVYSHCGKVSYNTSGPVMPSSVVYTSTNGAFVRYFADTKKRYRGVRIKYAVVDAYPGCNGSQPLEIVGDKSGIITSPFFAGGFYPNNYKCSWMITVPLKKAIHVHFDKFELEKEIDCNYDHVLLRDGGRSANAIGKRFCGKTVPVDITSTDRQIYIEFKSDEEIKKAGFMLHWTVVSLNVKTYRCGIRNKTSPITPRIVGGVDAPIHAWPWQARLNVNGHYKCGATLIHSRWLLTAAHCIIGAQMTPDNMRVVLADHNILVKSNEQHFTARKIILHNYNALSQVNDIALIELKKDVSVGAKVMPACLPKFHVAADTMCTATGWGDTQETGYADVLQEVQVPVIDNAVCSLPTWYGKLLKVESMFCAGYASGGKDTCLGDSGGPLVCENDGSWTIYGVISTGAGCALPRRPGIYTMVAAFTKWIRENTNGMVTPGQ